MSVEPLRALIRVLDAVAVGYLAIFFVINLLFVVVSFLRIRHGLRAEQVRPASRSEGSSFLPTITLLVPAYNEEVTIVESVRSLLQLRYPSFEVVICNAAVNAAQGEIVTSMDADSLLAPDALLRAAQPIADDPAGVLAVGAQVGLVNSSIVRDGRVVEMRLPSKWIARSQVGG